MHLERTEFLAAMGDKVEDKVDSPQQNAEQPAKPNAEHSPKPVTMLIPPAYVESPAADDPLPSATVTVHQSVLDAELPDDESSAAEAPPAPDGGWGWVIVWASFMTNFIVDGLCYSYGVFLMIFLQEFNESTTKTAFAGSLCFGCYLIVGPLVSALCNALGCRVVTIIGSILSASAFFAATFSVNVNMLLLTWGVFGGCALGCLYLPSIVIVGMWFEKKRAIATGICVAGSGVGQFIFPPVITVIMKKFGWKVSVYCLCAALLFVGVIAILFRPTPAQIIEDEEKKKSKKKLRVATLGEVAYEVEKKQIPDSCNSSTQNSCNDLNKEESNLNREVSTSTCSFDETKGKFKKSAPLGRRVLLRHMQNRDHLNSTQSLAFPAIVVSPEPEVKQDLNEKEELTKIQKRPPPPEYSPSVVEASSIWTPMPSEETGEPTVRSRSRLEVNHPLRKKNIFFSGSTMNIAGRGPQTRVASRAVSKVSVNRSEHNDEEEEEEVLPEESASSLLKKMHSNAMFDVLLNMLDLSLFKSPSFILLSVSSTMSMLGFLVPYMYISNFAVSEGIHVEKAVFLMSILGISNTIGRVVAGLITDLKLLDPVQLTNLSLMLGGALVASIPLLTSYPLLVAFAILFGFVIACMISLKTTVIVEVLGIDKLTNAFGLLLLFMGAASVAGVPLAGFLYDAMGGSYTYSFVAAGTLIGLSGLICIPLNKLSEWENGKVRRQMVLNLGSQTELGLPETSL